MFYSLPGHVCRNVIQWSYPCKALLSPDNTFGETHTKFRIWISLYLYIVFMLRCEGLQVSAAYSFVFASRRGKSLSRLNNKELNQCDVSVAFVLDFCWNYRMILWGHGRIVSVLLFWIIDQNQIKYNPHFSLNSYCWVKYIKISSMGLLCSGKTQLCSSIPCLYDSRFVLHQVAPVVSANIKPLETQRVNVNPLLPDLATLAKCSSVPELLGGLSHTSSAFRITESVFKL